MKTPRLNDRRRENRLRRKRSREAQLRNAINGAFLKENGAAGIDLPAWPARKLRRELFRMLEQVRKGHQFRLDELKVRHAKEMRELRDCMLPVIHRLGGLLPDTLNRVPVMEPIDYRAIMRGDAIEPSTMKVRTVDATRNFLIQYALSPEALFYAVRGFDGPTNEHILNTVREVAYMMGRIIESEAVAHLVYGEPLPSARTQRPIGRGLQRSLDEVLAEHPNDASEYIMRVVRTATAAADWRTAEVFGGFGLELMTRRARGEAAPA